MTKINARIVADSLSPQGHRITSFILTYPRIIHAEVMTHRMFSRNAASSRAIPFKKMVKMVDEDPFIPIAWQKDHKGMQGTEYIDAYNNDACFPPGDWLEAKNAVIQTATEMHEDGVTKQLCNRLLEPFMWYTALVTATEFDNFFELRCPKYEIFAGPEDTEEFACRGRSWKDLMKSNNGMVGDFDTNDIIERFSWSKSGAEIHIQALAEAMWDAMNESTPVQLKAGEWHIPFGDKMDRTELYKIANSITKKEKPEIYPDATLNEELVAARVAVARCARLSYMTFDGEIDYKKDIALHDRLLESRHMSPFEHVARAMSDEEYYSFIKGKYPVGTDNDGDIFNAEVYAKTVSEEADDWIGFLGENPHMKGKYGWCNNFRGFIQYRYIVE